MSKPIERLRARAKEGHAVVQFKDVNRNKFIAVAVDGVRCNAKRKHLVLSSVIRFRKPISRQLRDCRLHMSNFIQARLPGEGTETASGCRQR
jgi:hypothetical protein